MSADELSVKVLVSDENRAELGRFDRRVVTLVSVLTVKDMRGILDWYDKFSETDELPIGIIQYAASVRQGYALRLLDLNNRLTRKQPVPFMEGDPASGGSVVSETGENT